MTHCQAVWIVLLALNGSVALAQTTQPARSAQEGATEQTPSKDLLAGPSVDAEAAGATNPQFGGAGRARDRTSVLPRQWFGLLRTLDLDEDKAIKVRRIVQSFQAAARAHQQTNGQRLRELQGQVREARGVGRAVPAKVRRELGTLRSLGPKPATYQAKIWSLLTESQQKTMRTELAQIRQRIRERRAVQRTSDAKPQTDINDSAQRRLRFLRARQSPKIGPDAPKN